MKLCLVELLARCDELAKYVSGEQHARMRAARKQIRLVLEDVE